MQSSGPKSGHIISIQIHFVHNALYNYWYVKICRYILHYLLMLIRKLYISINFLTSSSFINHNLVFTTVLMGCKIMINVLMKTEIQFFTESGV
jgi:hypothetical protein